MNEEYVHDLSYSRFLLYFTIQLLTLVYNYHRNLDELFLQFFQFFQLLHLSLPTLVIKTTIITIIASAKASILACISSPISFSIFLFSYSAFSLEQLP